ncbi:MAG: hypothetical protein BAJALOKI1v1_20033 [Promethearchaeota archaeon]|nr:MAG: hypothetical protein BAJALOKI1v1_20033 [Candidatus Lokiarchaeota archaeon]
MKLKEKFLGAFIGSSLGDAIGELAFQFGTKDLLLKHVQSQNILRYTDDTAMAIGIAETIISTKNDWTTKQLAEQFHTNYSREPYRGYGMGPPTIFNIVERSERDYQEVATSLFGGEGSYGNGAAMRITPLGIFYYDTEDLYNIVERSAVATHTHPLGIDGATTLAKLLGILVLKKPENNDIEKERTDILTKLRDFAHTDEYKEKISRIFQLCENKTDIKKAEEDLGSNVLAFTSVPFAIYTFFRNPDSYRETLLDTVLISKDRDTVGAMVGGLLGAYLGIDDIPTSWIEKLENIDYIRQLATDLWKLKTKQE